MSQVALLRTCFTNSRDLLAFKMDPEIFSSGTYYRRMQTRTLIWETDASVLQMLQIAIFLQARARSQPVDRADAWFQLQSLKVIGTVPKKWRKGLFCCFLLQSWCHFDLEAHRVAILLLSCMKSRSSVSLSSNNLEAATWSVCADWIKRVWDTGLDVQSHISAFLRSDWLFWFCFVFFFITSSSPIYLNRFTVSHSRGWDQRGAGGYSGGTCRENSGPGEKIQAPSCTEAVLSSVWVITPCSCAALLFFSVRL